MPFYVWEDVRVWTIEIIPLILSYLGPVSSFSSSWIPLQANHPGAAAVAYGLIAGNVLLSTVVLKSQSTAFLITLPEKWQKLFYLILKSCSVSHSFYVYIYYQLQFSSCQPAKVGSSLSLGINLYIEWTT